MDFILLLLIFNIINSGLFHCMEGFVEDLNYNITIQYITLKYINLRYNKLHYNTKTTIITIHYTELNFKKRK